MGTNKISRMGLPKHTQALGFKPRLHVRFFACTGDAIFLKFVASLAHGGGYTGVTNSGDKMLQHRPHWTGLIIKPILLVVLKFYWLDILNLRRMCNKNVAG